ncbi:hypothetical protein [Mycoplasma sp. CSL10166]|uniref:hypothetical protein n=1 Tax=Mycoplasma sp. CSL10166 TaxID=2813825 RepID=UPI00197B35D5|nr:hypothetical protein [Mycoplasma sp. CSL10166]MBN4084248.1 hypothetical protein [Mycoplasma sp. CSL10166]
MKIKTFNKISGIEFRTSNIINKYYQLIIWIIEQSSKTNLEFNPNDLEEKFKEFCIQEQIYSYKNKKINRFNMFVGNLYKLGIIEKIIRIIM